MIIDLPQIATLEINPLLVDDKGVFAVNAQILIAWPTELPSAGWPFVPILRSWKRSS